MTGRAVVKWTPPAGASGRSVRGYGNATLIRDAATFPVVFGLLFMGVGAALHLLVVALVVVFVLVSATAAALWWITARAHRPVPVPVEDDGPKPQGPTPAQVAAMTRITVEVVDETPTPRRALPAAPPLAQPAYPVTQAEVA